MVNFEPYLVEIIRLYAPESELRQRLLEASTNGIRDTINLSSGTFNISADSQGSLIAGKQEGIDSVTEFPNDFDLFTMAQLELSKGEGINLVLSDPLSYSLFTESDIMDLGFGGVVFRKESDSVLLQFDLEKSQNLEAWEFIESHQFNVVIPETKYFLRVRADPQK